MVEPAQGCVRSCGGSVAAVWRQCRAGMREAAVRAAVKGGSGGMYRAAAKGGGGGT